MKSRYIEGAELSRIRASMPAKMWLPFALALETGMRIGDIAKIKKSDVFLKNGAYFVRFVAEKTKKSGEMPISTAVGRELLRGGSEWCFPSPKRSDSHITRQALYARIKTACKRVRLRPQGISPHSLRKNFAVDLYKREGLQAVEKALQHSRGDISEIYALADWLTGENAERPLVRGDLVRIIEIVKLALDKSV